MCAGPSVAVAKTVTIESTRAIWLVAPWAGTRSARNTGFVLGLDLWERMMSNREARY
jgi:hypothetical protein